MKVIYDKLIPHCKEAKPYTAKYAQKDKLSLTGIRIVIEQRWRCEHNEKGWSEK